MLFPNKLASTIDRVFKTDFEFKKYSTYYTNTNSSNQNDSTARTYISSMHKSRKKQIIEPHNKTICLFKHNRVLQDNKRKVKENKDINNFTIQVTEPKVIRRFSHDINTLIKTHKLPKKEEKQITNVELYQDCIKMIDNSTQLKSYAKDIINYISSTTLASSTMYNHIRKRNKPTSNNNYFDIILNNVIRKVSFYNATNEELTIENVMNLLINEGNILKNETDLYMNKYCSIKNFSTYIDINNEGKDIQYLPLINSTRPLTKNEYISIEKEINNSKNEKKDAKFPIDYSLRARLGRIDQRVGQNNKKRKMRRIKKYRPNGEVYYEEEFYTDSEDNDKRLNSNDLIGGGGAQGGIWDTYNKMQNKKGKNIRKNNNSDLSIVEGNKKHLVLNSNVKNRGKNDTNKSMNFESKEDDITNNNEMCTQFIPRNKRINNNNNNFATISTKEDSQINSYSRRRVKEETHKEIKGNILSLLEKKDDKEDGNEDEEYYSNNTKSKKGKKVKIKLDKKKKDENEKNSSIYNDISSIKEDQKKDGDNKDKDIKREETITLSNYSRNDNNKEDDEEEDDEDDIINYNKDKLNNDKEVTEKKKRKKKKKNQKKSITSKDDSNNVNNSITNQKKEITSNNSEEKSNNGSNNNNNTEENIASSEKGQGQLSIDNSNKESNTNTNNSIDITSSQGGHHTKKSSLFQNPNEESHSITNKKGKSKSKNKSKKKNKKDSKNQKAINNEQNKEDPQNPQIIIIEKKETNKNLPQSIQSSNQHQSNQSSQVQSHHVKQSPSVISNNINIKGITDTKSIENQQQGNVFFDEDSPLNTSQHILLKAIDQSPRKTPLTFKKQIVRFNSIKSKFYKTEEENDKVLIEGQKKVLESKKKEFLNRLDKVIQPPRRPDDFTLLSNATKIKDIHIIEKIKYEMFNETTEEGKERYLEMLNQINALKRSDVNSYISELEREFEPFQEEIDAIVKSRKIEERLNKFMQHFSEYRMKEIQQRNTLGDSIKVVDHKFTTSVSEKLYAN